MGRFEEHDGRGMRGRRRRRWAGAVGQAAWSACDAAAPPAGDVDDLGGHGGHTCSLLRNRRCMRHTVHPPRRYADPFLMVPIRSTAQQHRLERGSARVDALGETAPCSRRLLLGAETDWVRVGDGRGGDVSQSLVVVGGGSLSQRPAWCCRGGRRWRG